MATQSVSGGFHEAPNGTKHYNIYIATWASLGDDDDGEALFISEYADKTVQVTGTFVGATVTLEGSNDNSNWNELHDSTGAVLSFTTSGMMFVSENPLYIRPNVTGGTGSSTNVVLCSRKK